jgi:hypothetical protein
MWTFDYAERTDVPPDALWQVIADIERWPQIDSQIDRIEIEGPVAMGTRFRLKPKGGPSLAFRIGAFDPPTRYADVCLLPLAEMTTIHQITPGDSTVVAVRIEIKGPLAWLWGPLVGRKHARGVPALTQKMIEAARTGA